MELTRYQKLLLAILAGMLVFFGTLMVFFRTHPGAAFEEGLLKVTHSEGAAVIAVICIAGMARIY